MDTETRIITERKEKLQKLAESGVEAYPHGFSKNTNSVQLKESYAYLKAEEHPENSPIYSIAGRIMTLRMMGKASFATIQDEVGTMQLYIKQDNLGEKDYAFFKTLDMGDFIGVEGPVFKTKMGEISVEVKKLTLLSKAIRPLPEKFHGVKDPEIRHRKRYLDLIANPEAKKTFTLRSKAIKEIREYLAEQGYLEVETPVLQAQYGGAAARPFITKHNTLNMDLYLRISPELYLKRLLVGGFEKVFDINKNFRNEGIDFDHNPEFTMIEWYEAYADYNKMMDMNEELVKRIAQNVFGKMTFKFKDHEVNLDGKWPRIPMISALKEFAEIDVEKMNDEDLYDLCNQHDYDLNEKTRGHMINFLFEKLVEEKIIQPTFIIDHPVEVSPLTKKHRSKEGCVERAELFICGTEFSNMYSELNDPVEQRVRLEEQEMQRQADAENNYPMDEDFCEALEYAMPPAGGIGIGIDRLMILLTESTNIREVILFPTLRPKEQ